MSHANGWTLRPAFPEDAHRIAEVHVRAWRVGYADLMPPDALATLSVGRRTARWAGRLNGYPGCTYNAADGEGVAGFSAVATPPSDPGSPACGELIALYVDPDHWNRGVGHLLHQAAMAHLATAECCEPVLWVLSGNVRARAFYARRGWRDDHATAMESWSGVDVPVTRLRRGPPPPR